MAVSNRKRRISEALSILVDLGMPRAQHNERSALCLLAILNLSPDKPWSEAQDPLMGITPIMDWARKHYKKIYAPNTPKRCDARPCISLSKPGSRFTTPTNRIAL